MKVEQWHNDIDSVTEKFVRSFGSLTKSQLNWKPGANKWSIAQNIAHLMQLNNSYFQNFEEIKKGIHEIPPGNTLSSTAAKSLQVLKPYTGIDRIKTANTWSIWQPKDVEYDVAIMSDFINHQQHFKSHIAELKPFITGEVFIKYPGESDLIFILDDCVDFLIQHEHRHCIQAMENKRALSNEDPNKLSSSAKGN